MTGYEQPLNDTFPATALCWRHACFSFFAITKR